MQRIFGLCTLLTLCLLPGIALAAPDPSMGDDEWENILLAPEHPIFAELQIADEIVVEMIRERISEESFCPEPTSCILGAGDCVLEPPEFLEGGWIATEVVTSINGSMSYPLLVTIPTKLTEKTTECTYDAQCAGVSVTAQTLIEISSENGQICGELYDVRFGDQSLSASHLQGVLNAAKAKIGVICGDMPAFGIQAMLGGGIETSTSTFGHDESRSRIRYRRSYIHPDWDGQTPTGSPVIPEADQFTGDWSLTLSAGLLKQTFGSHLRRSLWQEGAVNWWEMPTLSWLPLGGAGGRVRAQTIAEVAGAGCSVELDPLQVSTYFSAGPAGSNTLVANASIDWDAVDSDVFACALKFSVFSGGAAPIVLPLIQTIAAIVADTHVPEEVTLGEVAASCEEVDDTEFHCLHEITLPNISLSSSPHAKSFELDLNDVTGGPGGLTLHGSATLVGPPKGTPSVGLSIDSIEHGVHGGCNDLSVGYSGTATVNGYGGFCGFEKRADPLDIYTVVKGSGTGLPVDFELGLGGSASSQAAFFAHPYALDLTFYTTAGTRSVRVAAPEPAEGFEQPIHPDLSYNAMLFFEQWSKCQQTDTTYLGIPAEIEFSWIIDPPPWHELAVETRDVRLATKRFTVTLESIQVEALASTLPTRLPGAAFDFQSVPLQISGTVLLDDGTRGGAQSVPFSSNTTTNLLGIPSADGSRMNLALDQSRQVSLELDAASLPRGATGLSIPLALDPGNVSLGFELSH